MTLPKITVVTPSFNQGDYIEHTIKSVLDQQYSALEYIVIDGGSTDHTAAILQSYDDRLAYWCSEPDGGQTDAINKGFARSTGDIMGWLNSDDVLLSNALWRIGEWFQKNPNTRVATGLRRIIDSNGAFVRNEMMWMPHRDVIRHGAFIAQETTYWHRSVWEDIGTLDDTLYFAMDYEYWQRMVAAGYHFDLIPAYVGGYRVHDDAKSTKATRIRQRELADIFQRYDIASDEASALAELDHVLGADWRHKQRMLKEFGEKSISNNPDNYVRFFNLLQTRIIGKSLVNLHRLYNNLRERPVY